MAKTFTSVGAGALALGSRPKAKTIPLLGADVVVTLLTEREGGRQIGSAARKGEWVWVPFTLKDMPADAVLLAAVERVADHLRAGSRVFIHCSAGLHRTGSFSYAVLRHLGHDHEAAMATIREARAITAEQCLGFLGRVPWVSQVSA